MKIKMNKAIKAFKNYISQAQMPNDWRKAYHQKVAKGWARIDRLKFIRDFMVSQYESIDEKYNQHGEPYNDKAVRDYFHKIRTNEKPATDEATKFANDYFRIN